MSLRKAMFLLSFGASAIAIPVLSQAPGEVKPSFEVASIKPNTSVVMGVSIMTQPGGRFVATGMTLRSLMTFAYRVRDFQILGGPNWIASDRWNIEARAEEGSIPPQTGPRNPSVPDPIALRVQSLVEDRFQLKFHRETRELPAYELTIAKGGSKVKLSQDQSPFRPPGKGDPPPPPMRLGGPLPRGSMLMGGGKIEANGVAFASFVQMLSQQLGRTVIDKTGLTGLYDIKMQWTPTPEMSQGIGAMGPAPAGVDPPPASDPSGPSIFTVLQEELGLKLESTKGPVEVLLIDSVQKPTEN